MTDLSQLTERDILIRLDGKFDMIEGRVKTLEDATQVLSNWKIATEAVARGRAGVWGFLGGIPGVAWAVAATGGMLYAWIH